ncbi:MAG: hypothetical protein D8M59_10950 [Planctomycetes bacterium]|nr:hypothetical protein [Planctomycetota bacterium]NOG54132.1 hypothetical protein [Planctomycetota bacterium]
MTQTCPDTRTDSAASVLRHWLLTVALVLSMGTLTFSAQEVQEETQPPQNETTAQEQPQEETIAPPIGEEDIQKAMEAAPKGRLAIRVVQGTEGGDPIGEIVVHLSLLHRGSLVDSRDLTTDDHGVVIVDDIMAAMEVWPQISVEYAGCTYQTGAEDPIGPQNPEGTLTLTVFDVTAEQPDWGVMMMHIFVDEMDGGLVVRQTAVVENPSDHTWLGDLSEAESHEGHNHPEGEVEQAPNAPTARFTFPAAATDIQLEGGFHGWCCTERVEDTLIVRMPMMPGQSMFSFAYRIPVSDEKVSLTFGASAAMASAVVLLPDAGFNVTPVGLQKDAERPMGDRMFHMYTAKDVAAGARVGVSLAGLMSDGGSADTTKKLASGRNVILIVAGLLVVFAFVGLVFRRSA